MDNIRYKSQAKGSKPEMYEMLMERAIIALTTNHQDFIELADDEAIEFCRVHIDPVWFGSAGPYGMAAHCYNDQPDFMIIEQAFIDNPGIMFGCELRLKSWRFRVDKRSPYAFC